MQLSEQWVRRRLEWCAVILDAFEIAGITSERERNEHKVRLVKSTCQIFLDGLTKADGEFLAGICCNALWSIRHERIGQSAIDDGTDELIRIQYTRVCHYRHGFDIAEFLHEWTQVFVCHLCRNQRVT